MDDLAHASFGAWLRRRRKALDLTQAALAALVGCSKDLIVRFEGDARRPSRQVAALLATHLQLAPEERADFIRTARAELAADRLPPPTQSVPRPALVAARSVPAAPIGNLPAELSSFVGREREVAELGELLHTGGARLITLTGPGGTGKTRLALRVAAALAPAYPDGVWFVDLAPLSDPQHVAGAIAQSLQLIDVPDRTPQERVSAWLRQKQLLLVLDNYEQVVAAAPLVLELLHAAPRLTVLVTSRVPLRLRGEQEYSVAPLSLPETTNAPTPDAVAQYEAVQLFIARARAVRRSFQISHANAPAVAEICARLDGLPLAIELAAARIRLFSPEVLLVRLQQAALPMLTGGERDLPARQQTIRATIEWSYRLLSPAQQRLFARLGVFVGGWTLISAERVCGADEGDIAEHLQALIEHSLVTLDEAGDEPRFMLLDVLREYACECLAEHELELIRRRHGEHFARQAEQLAPFTHGPRWPMIQAFLDRESANIEAAIHWSRHSPIPADREYGMRLIGSLWSACYRSRRARYRHWAALAALPGWAGTPTLAWARVLSLLGHAAWDVGDGQTALAFLTPGLELARQLRSSVLEAEILTHLAQAYILLQELELANDALQRGLAVNQQTDDRERQGWILYSLAELRLVGDPSAAAMLLQQSREAFDRAEDPWGAGIVVRLQAILAAQQDDSGAADRLHAQSSGLMGESGDALETAMANLHRGDIARRSGDAQLAIQFFDKWITVLEQQCIENELVRAYSNLAAAALTVGEKERAQHAIRQALTTVQWLLADRVAVSYALLAAALFARVAERELGATRLVAACTAIRVAGGIAAVPTFLDDQYPAIITSCRSRLGDGAFDAAWAAGQALTPAQAIAEALALVTRGPASEGGSCDH